MLVYKLNSKYDYHKMQEISQGLYYLILRYTSSILIIVQFTWFSMLLYNKKYIRIRRFRDFITNSFRTTLHNVNEMDMNN